MRDPAIKYNVKITWATRCALNCALARRTQAANSLGVPLKVMPSLSHVIVEVIAKKLDFAMPTVELDDRPNDRVSLMFQSPWRIKKAFSELCEAKGVSQNAMINELLGQSLEEMETKINKDPDQGWEPTQGFTCIVNDAHKRKIFERCASKILACSGRRQWGIGDMINMLMASATGEPLPGHFFEEPHRPDDDIFNIIVGFPVPLHQALTERADAENTSMAKLIRRWMEEYVIEQKA